jgi:hypothetical protein
LQIKKCKLARGTEAKENKTNGIQQGLGVCATEYDCKLVTI